MLTLTDAESRLYLDSSPRAFGAAAASTGFREARQSHRFTARPRGRERAAIKSKKVATLGAQKVAVGTTGAR